MRSFLTKDCGQPSTPSQRKAEAKVINHSCSGAAMPLWMAAPPDHVGKPKQEVTREDE